MAEHFARLTRPYSFDRDSQRLSLLSHTRIGTTSNRLRNSDRGNGSHNVSLPKILKRVKVSQMLRSSCIRLLLVPFL